MDAQLVPAPESQGPLAKPGVTKPSRWPPVALLLCTVCLVLFAAIAASVPEPSWDALGKWGYPSAERVWDGAYWGLLSSTVVHLALWHVAFNVYRYVRNPMYFGASLALAGAALFYETGVLWAYAGGFLVLTHLVVVLYEEPTLRQTFGDDYEK